MSAPLLAVVIPAYRARYLRETMQSFAAQTDKRFRLLVVDDGSPEPLEEIVLAFSSQLDLRYHRFDDNCGIARLVGHWERALALADAPWLWLFSDDDAVEPDAVASVLGLVEQDPVADCILRLDVTYIDEMGKIIGRGSPFPEHLSGPDYLRRVVGHPEEPCMIQNIVFPRSVYQAEGGFFNTLGGYSADVATWPRFAMKSGVRRVPGGGIRFRYHPDSVGTSVGLEQDDRLPILLDVAAVLKALRQSADQAGFSDQPWWTDLEFNWFWFWIRYQPRRFTRREAHAVREVMHSLWPEARWRTEWWLLRSNLWRGMRGWGWLRQLRQWGRRVRGTFGRKAKS